MDWTRAEVEKRAGIQLAPAKPYKFTTTADLLGWHKAVDGKNFFTLFVETGRVKKEKKIALREIAEKFPHLEFRLTTNQNVILAKVGENEKAGINPFLRRTEFPWKTRRACCMPPPWHAPPCPPAVWPSPRANACCPG